VVAVALPTTACGFDVVSVSTKRISCGKAVGLTRTQVLSAARVRVQA